MKDDENSVRSPFLETTMSTSQIMSALAAQMASPKRTITYLQATARLFYKILARVFSTGEVALVLQAPGTNVPLRVVVPSTARIPSYFLLPLRDDEFFEHFREQWNNFATVPCLTYACHGTSPGTCVDPRHFTSRCLEDMERDWIDGWNSMVHLPSFILMVLDPCLGWNCKIAQQTC